MSFTITNQKPGVLDPMHTLPLKGDYDPVPAIRRIMVDPLFDPLGQHPVTIVDQKGTPLDEDGALQLVLDTGGESVDMAAEDVVKDLYQQALVHYDKQNPRLVNRCFVVQAAGMNKMPTPTPRTIYSTATDVLPAAKALLAGRARDDGEFFASLSYVFDPETLGFWFQSAAAFDDFKVWLDAEVQHLSAVFPPRTNNLMAQFLASDLKGLTESLVLRSDDNSDNEEFSFARVLVHMLMKYHGLQGGNAPAPPEMGVMPFSMGELFLPRTVVLVNVEVHARSTRKKIENEWKLIDISLRSPVRVLSSKKLSKLTALPRMRARSAAQAANAASNKQAPTGRSAQVRFRKQPPNRIAIFAGVTRALKRMKEVNRSHNVFKKTRSTFIKPNRRDPDDYNKPGKIVSTHFLPDLHLFLDCSGSISEDNYQQSVVMLINMAKKLNVNLYFSSFSHVLSQETLIKVRGRSTKRIWQDFCRIPKVDGGTEFEQIWHYINAGRVRKERLSLVITDFGWTPPTRTVEHPKNLYYAPVANMDWNAIIHMAKGFTKGMDHIEPAIAQRLIGITL